MKPIFNYLMLTLFLSIAGMKSLHAQDGYGGHWFLGLNGGAAWQQMSDVKNTVGGGAGFYLGKNIFYSPTAPLSLDLRFRYLFTSSYGQDYILMDITNNSTFNGTGSSFDPNYSNTGFLYLNNQTNFNDFSLEARLNFENLRRKNRIWLSLYGGIGVGVYGVRTDQLDGSWVFGNTYSGLYTAVRNETGLTETEIANRIRSQRDHTYETPLAGHDGNNIRGTFTPDVGIELGYWITKRFAIGVGHRVNWIFDDNFDGVYRGKNTSLHHYANLFMHFKISGNSSGRVINNNNNNINNNPVVERPVVDITTPDVSPYSTGSGTTRIACTIRNVETRSGVMMYVNNVAVNDFSFNPQTDVLDAFVSLNIGANTVRITGTNASGSAEDQVTIIYQQNIVNVRNPPAVNITNPISNPFNTNSNSANINATVTNISNASAITFTVNGQNIRNFNFSGTSFTANGIGLVQGTNTVVISASNADGTASDQVNIIYQPVTANPPTVNITVPGANPYNTQNASETIRATVTNVTNANNITFTVNGQNIRNFTFSGTAFVATNIALQQGTNSVVISATNNDGNASDQVSINYQPVRTPVQPTVTITQPAADPFTSTQATANIRATITNVPNRTNVNFFVNGQPQSNFNFSGTSFSADNVVLQQGSNNILISASNPDGTASDQTVIVYQPAKVPNPPTVTITNPAANPFNTQTATQTINATITNVRLASNVTLSVNGQTRTGFTLNGTVFTATNVTLAQGSNTIVITATNPDGTASDQTVINYQPSRVPTPPTVTITNPAANPFNTQTATQTINATITNVRSTANVTFTVNGQNQTGFTLNGTVFTANNVNLAQGSNTIVITANNQDGNASDQTVINYQPARVPTPPTVTITNPAANPYTSAVQTLSINATITNVRSAANVTFTVNGAANSNFTLNGTVFTANNISLNQGNNTFVITATNQDGNASDQTVVIYKPMRNPAPPTVVITNPATETSNTAVPNVNINATVVNISNASGISFTVNGQPNSNFTLNGTAFSASNIRLNEGNNTFVITATNQDGNASDNASITYTKAQEVRTPTPPTVTITNPSTDPFTTNSATAVINATITNVQNAQNVTFTVNGQNVRNFSLNGSSFSATGVNLNPGNNTIVVTGTNRDGNASDNVTIVYNAPVQPPVVTITAPATNPFTSGTNTANIRATILNVANANGVAFMANGQYLTNFSFSGTSFSASNLALNAGNNTFTITGTNSAGTDTKSTVIIYAPQPVPAIGDMTTAVQPAESGCRVTVYAGLTNVSNPSQITFKINGVVTTGFSFEGGVFNYSHTVTSNNPSSISYEITVNTGGGTATQTRRADVSGCAVQTPPDVRNGNVQISMQNGRCMANVTAQLVNVANANMITFTVNGQRNTNFTYSNGNFSAAIDLTGVNSPSISFVISATTPAGSDSESITGSLANCVSRPVITNMRATQVQVRGSFFATVTANISGVTSPSQITFLVNGVANTNFTFVNGVFTATEIPVNPGRNTFSITATNTAGTATDSKELTVSGNTGGQQNGTNNSTNTLNGQPVDNNNGGGSNNSGGGNKPVDNTDKGKEAGKGGKMDNKTTDTKPTDTKPTEIKPESKGGKLGGDKKEGDK